MRLFVHIGSHKTGTTAVQAFAAHNRQWLADRGLLYPGLDLVGRAPGRSHMGAVTAFLKVRRNTDLGPEEGQAFLTAAAEQARERGSDVLFSAENIFRLRWTKRRRLYARLRETFADFETVPVAALRRQDNLADSLYRTVVRGEMRPERVPESWEEFLASREPMFHYRAILERARQGLGGDPILLPYAGATRREMVPAFFAALGVDVREAPTPPRRVNTSFDFIDCQAKLRLHDLGAEEAVFRRHDRFVRAHPMRSPYSFFDEESRRRLLAEHEEDNRALCAAFPQLEQALSPTAEPDFPQSPDAAAEEMVEQRLERFRGLLGGTRVS